MGHASGNPTSRADLLATLASIAVRHGIAARIESDSAIVGETEAIKAKWFLGGNKSAYRFSCRLDEPSLTATFRESILDRSWGLAPPAVKIESEAQRGATVRSTRREKAVGGGGDLALGPWREACAAAARKAGWTFRHEPVGIP